MSVFGWDYPAGCSSVPGDDAELPETCPMCGAPNQDEHGEPTYAADPAYCSERCAVADSEAQAIADRLEASDWGPRVVPDSGHLWLPLEVPVGADGEAMVAALLAQAEEVILAAYRSPS